ncbi:MAG: hypothetical protein V1702_00715 [Candidatus Woesearchaeota archaeon]
MAKKVLACIVLIMALLIVPSAMAGCWFDQRPLFKVKISEINYCSFISSREEVSADTDVAGFMKLRNQSGQFVCDNVVLTPDERKIFRDLINQFNKDSYLFSYVHIDKQADSAYEKFLEKIQKSNSNKCDCKYYSNVSRVSGWTAYIETEDCNHDDACKAIPPEGCLSRKVYDVTNNFLLMLVITIAVPLMLLMMLYNFFKR